MTHKYKYYTNKYNKLSMKDFCKSLKKGKEKLSMNPSYNYAHYHQT